MKSYTFIQIKYVIKKLCSDNVTQKKKRKIAKTDRNVLGILKYGWYLPLI